MRRTGLVSIVIPMFNRASLIEETLDSITSQTYRDFECIIIDDHSTDDSISVVSSYIEKDSRFSLEKRPDHLKKGACACRNFGFTLSQGEFVNFFDSDDIMSPTKLEVQVKLLQENEGVEYTTGYIQQFESKIGDKNKTNNLQTSNTLAEAYYIGEISWGTVVPLWRGAYLRTIELFDESLTSSQDFEFNVRVLAAGIEPIFSEGNLVYYRRHMDSITMSDKHLKSEFRSRQKHFSVFSWSEVCTKFYGSKIISYYRRALEVKDRELIKEIRRDVFLFFF